MPKTRTITSRLTPPFGERVKAVTMKSGVLDFEQNMPPKFYREVIGFSLKQMKDFLADAEKELNKYFGDQPENHCIAIMPVIVTDPNDGNKMDVLLTPSIFFVDPNNPDPKYRGEFRHQMSMLIHPSIPINRADPDPYCPLPGQPTDGLNHGQGAPKRSPYYLNAKPQETVKKAAKKGK